MSDAEELLELRQAVAAYRAQVAAANERAEAAEIRHKEEEDRRRKEEVLRKAAEARQKEEEDRRKEEEVRRKVAETRQKEEEDCRKEEEARRKEEEARRKEEEVRRKAAEQQLAPSDYNTYLDFCHRDISLKLAIETNARLAFTGIPLFWSPGHVGVVQKLVQSRKMTDEQDMRMFQFLAVELGVREVLLTFLQETKAAADMEKQKQQQHDQGEEEREQEESRSEETHSLPTTILFESVSYGLSVYDSDDPDLDNPNRPAYKPALVLARQQDRQDRGRPRGETDDGPPLKRVSSPTRKHFPDQWLIREEVDGRIRPVFIVEYKAAHKLRASMVKLALDNASNGGLFAAALRNKLSNTVPQEGDEKMLAEAQNATAAVVTQAFHYMVEFGLCYCYATSGEMILLLHLRPEEPETLYYHLCVPADEMTERISDQMGLTMRSAVSVVSALALLALDSPLLSQRWKLEADSRLKRWPTAYPQMEAHLPQDSGSEESDGRPAVPLLPPPGTGEQDCRDPTKPGRKPPKGDGDGDFTPARSTGAVTGKSYATRSAASRTQGSGSSKQLIQQLQEQLGEDMDNHCDALDRYRKCGAIGTLFRLTLPESGYCVVAKGVERENARRLEAETAIYDYLHDWQGDLVPVCLGTVELVHDYISMRGIHVTHMLVLSYGGEPALAVQVRDRPVPTTETLQQLAHQAWFQLAATGIEHGDEREANMVWNEERQRMMCIDFDRAWIVKPKTKKGRGSRETGETDERLWKKQRLHGVTTRKSDMAEVGS
ncbi:hypothetical protein CMQ_6665 [Grosmannia clavigera kw1407]|uniref:Protein kinase domain-containing protein n=1 Tax=Grosmannia clavigera (strain kw1407 / UAMH 11150) TaxID=655863 RepID=F0X810_GROCL|nr:uncharacterized protein CMQ_6665 [Grosmannia clavigera kw1407]EFX06344.1 hypothetical protein CMQ_6665 [Grosmannia clavigera kw1407]